MDHTEDALINKTLGSYKVLRPLGKGGMGAIYEVEHTLIGKKSALKILHKDFANHRAAAERFFLEAKAVNKIRHQNIVDISDYGKTIDGRPYFIMELLEGQSLAELLHSGPLPLRRAFHIIKQICSALKASHEVGIIHRDLKPQNIFLIQMGPDPDFVKVLDFGIAKLSEPEGKANIKSRTLSGELLGTPQYMSPEQLASNHADHCSDIYALGLMFFEMLLGRPLFEAPTPADAIVRVITEPTPLPSERLPALPKEFQEVILKAIQKEPSQRYQSIKEFTKALVEAEAAAVLRGEMPPALITYSSQLNIPVVKGLLLPEPVAAPVPAPEPPSVVVASTAEGDQSPSSTATAQQEPKEIPPSPADAPTTLSLGKRPVPTSMPRSGLLLGAAGFVALGVILVVLWPAPAVPTMVSKAPLMSPSSAPVEAPLSHPASTSQPTPEEAPQTITITFSSTPTGATVSKGREVLGKTPCKVELTEGESLTVRLTLDGYVPLTKTITATQDQRYKLTLSPEKKKAPEKKRRFPFFGPK